MKSLGLDFGTANSSIAVSDGVNTDVLALDRAGNPSQSDSALSNAALSNSPLSDSPLSDSPLSVSIPSTFFFDFEDDITYIGDDAYERYYLGDKGRFLRSFKSALGTSTLEHEIQIKRNRYSVKDIIEQYLGIAIGRAEACLQRPIDHLVVGRPVHFVDHDPAADSRAEDSLRDIMHNLGVKNIEFQLEPIAAALNYGVTVNSEELVLVIDIGAGTSDFSVVKFTAANQGQAEVISNCGVHIGGNDFDKVIALNQAMPLFGYKQRFKRRAQLEVPNHYYQNASSWHKIDLLYDRKVINAMQEISPQVFDPELIDRFLNLLSSRQVHNVLAEVERMKKGYSDNDRSIIDLSFLEHGLEVNIDKEIFHHLIDSMCDDIISNAKQAIELAGLQDQQIDTVYVTGGSMGIKHLHDKVVQQFAESRIIEGDRATSVARGLALYAHQIGF
ncbi:MAG: putative chaperone protein [Arenicella sp.]|jgi:hypothetical chaperone protein